MTPSDVTSGATDGSGSSTRSASTLRRTMHAAVIAGVACGAMFGVADSIVAARIGTADLDAVAFLGCTAAAVFEYVLAWTLALVIAAVVLKPLLSRKTPFERLLALMRIGLVMGLFLEIYWWSRPYLFYGQSALGGPRLAATAGIVVVAGLLAWISARPLLRLVLARTLVLVAGVFVIALCGAGYIWLYGGRIGARGEIGARNEKVPNVLLVVVDALRQDTLGCYGHPRVKTPNVDRLAREGVLFENAFVQAPFTWSSFGSLLTGKYPRRHGLLGMAPNLAFPANITLPLHLDRACFAESSPQKGACLAPDDYVGATFHTGTLSNGSGLLRGFDYYFEQMAGHGIVQIDSPWSVFRSDLLLHVFSAKIGTKVGNDTAGTARDWLGAHADRRFVSMVHLYSTHTPYDPPQDLRAQYCDPAYTGPLKAFYSQHREAIEAGEKPTAADVEQIRNLYLAGVAEADRKIGALMDELRERGVLDDTIVIVTSDHGESLGEGGLWQESLWEHDHMVQTNLRIPLVMRWPKGLPAGTRVKGIVDEIDVLPTVCELLGLELPHEDGPHGVVDGKSLMPLVRGTATAVRELSFAENGVFAAAQDVRWKLVVPADLLDTDVALEPETHKPWLIDLEADPNETTNLAATNPAESARLIAALRAWSRSMPIRKADEELSPRQREYMNKRLEELGYGGRNSHGVRVPGQPPNKKP